VIGSTHRTPTGAMITDPTIAYPTQTELIERFDAHTETEDFWMDAVDLTTRLVNNAAPANVFLLGVAVQAGVVPVSVAHVETAIDLNGIAIEANQAAFSWGRRWASSPSEVEVVANAQPSLLDAPVIVPKLGRGLQRRVDELGTNGAAVELVAEVGLRTADLIGYQNADYAKQFLDRVEIVLAAERAVDTTSTALTIAVAKGLHKLMAYKDEYDVARLLLAPEANHAVNAAGGSTDGIIWHLHPPFLRALGMKRKLHFGSGTRHLFRLLAAGRRLRGTSADPFGRTRLRRLERQLIDDYNAAIDLVLAGLSVETLDQAIEIANLADQVRGFEHLKEKRAAEFQSSLANRLAAYP